MSVMASQITSLTIVYSTVYSGADERKHQRSSSLAFVWGIHWWPVKSLHKGPVTRKMFPFDDVIMPSSSHWCLMSLMESESLANPPFSQQVIQANNNVNIIALHNWPLVREIHVWPMGPPHIRQVMLKSFACHCDIIKSVCTHCDLQYIPRNMHTVLLCFALLWLSNRS